MNTPTINELTALLQWVKSDISDEYRAFNDDDTPGIQLTLCMNAGGWSYQTGDNSFMGSAYHYPHWSVRGIYRDTNCRELAREMREELLENIALAQDEDQFCFAI